MTTAADQDSSYTRLHITPLDPGLLPVVLSTSLQPKARNISYHSLATFPEKRYGFVELPAEDAAKLKKKLNGAVVKGLKLKVDVAKPDNRPEPLGEAAMAEDKVIKKKEKKVEEEEDKSKKRKRKAEEIPGIELYGGRKVKRGWTVADEPKVRKDKKDKSKKGDKKEKRREVRSKYTDHPECLVKAIIPTKATDDGEVDEDGKKKRKKSKSKQVIVHEFAKTTKFPTFLKDTTSSSTERRKELEFVDGKGWVDEEGNVVETVKTRPQPVKPTRAPSVRKNDGESGSKEKDQVAGDKDSSSDESDSEADKESEDGESGDSESEDKKTEKKTKSPEPEQSSSNNVVSPPPKPTNAPTSILKSDPARPRSSSSAKGLSIKIPPATPGKPEVHPLEALYKRNKQTDGAAVAEDAAPEAQPFSFFDSGDVEEEDKAGASSQVPMTPFSRMDYENRGIRSAAPTPDTAHPSRAIKAWPFGTGDIEEEEEDEDEDESEEDQAGPADTEMREDDEEADVREGSVVGGAAGGTDESASDFQKYFWEHRGDLNRSWKKRRKTAAKDKRYRENRARAERAI